MKFDNFTLAQVIVFRGAGLRQREIAERVGVSQQTVSRYTAHAREHAEDPVWLVEWAAFHFKAPLKPPKREDKKVNP